MRAVFLPFVLLCVLGCKEEQEGFELNGRRIAELAAATCSCSDSVSNQTCAIAYEDSLNAALLAQVGAGRVRVNGALWSDCIAELRDCPLVADVCEKLFEGTLQENDACASNQECGKGMRCVPGKSDDAMCAATGTCEQIEIFERGDRCDRTGECEDDDVCGVAASGADADAGVRDAAADSGELDEDAGDDSSDDANDDGASGGETALVCRKPLERGDACPIAELGVEGTLLCVAGTACVPDGAEVVCGRPIAAGERCAFAIGAMQSAGPCKSGNFCDPISGVCEPFDFPEGAELGEDCETRSDCLPGLTCIDDECARLLPNGSECAGDGQCAAHCFESECAPTYVACGLQ